MFIQQCCSVRYMDSLSYLLSLSLSLGHNILKSLSFCFLISSGNYVYLILANRLRNIALKNFFTSKLHSRMCKLNKLREYRELKEDFECKKYLYGVSDVGSKLLFRFRSGIYGFNEEHSACVLCECESVEQV